MAHIQLLPDEIIELILSALLFRDILASAATCRQFYHLVDRSSSLQLILKLAISGLRRRRHATTTSTLSAREQLDSLNESEKRWLKLEPMTIASISGDSGGYELRDGLFGRAILLEGERWHRGLVLYKLSLQQSGVEASYWKRYEDFGFLIGWFTFDVGNDLLVLVEAPVLGAPLTSKRVPIVLNYRSTDIFASAKRIFLRTLSGNDPHPLAAQKVLGDSPRAIVWDRCDVKICGSYLAAYFSSAQVQELGPNEGVLLVWQWKTGNCVDFRVGVAGFAFLDEESIAIITITFDTVILRGLGNGTKTAIEIVRLSSPRARVHLELPFHSAPWYFDVLSEVPHLDLPSPPEDHTLGPDMMEETSTRIFVLALGLNNTDLHVFVSIRPLLDLLDATATLSKKYPISIGGRPRKYAWAEWGPQNTFWLNGIIEASFTAVCGSRFCAISKIPNLFDFDPSPDEHETGIIQSTILGENATEDEASILVMDFNMRPVIHANAHRQQATSQPMHRFQWTTSVDGQGVISSLPFRAVQKELNRSYYEPMITPGYLLCLRRGMGRGNICDVLNFTGF